MAKGFRIKAWHIIAFAIIVLVAMGYIPLADWLAGEPAVIKKPVVVEEELVSVTKPVDFYVLDRYAGGGINAPDDSLDIYDKDMILLEQLDPGTDGTIATSAAYPSGTVFNIKLDDSSGFGIKWWNNVVVPKMTPADAESLTVNGPIVLKMFDYTAPTVTVRDNLGNSYSDTENLNATTGATPGADVFTLLIDLSQGTDNDGYMQSYDPIYGIDLKCVVILKIDTAGYETVTLTGYEGSVEKGSAMYYWRTVSPESVSRWVTGNTVRQEGSTTVSFKFDMSGYAVDTANLDIIVYVYANPDYFVSKGNWGPDKLQVGSTINLDLFYSI